MCCERIAWRCCLLTAANRLAWWAGAADRAAVQVRRGRRTSGRRANLVLERASRGRIGRLWRRRPWGRRRHCRTGAAAEGVRKALIDRRRWRHCARRGHRHLEVPARTRCPLQIQPALCTQLPAASASGSSAAPNTWQLSGGSARERLGEGGNYCKAWVVKSKLLGLYHRAPSPRKSDSEK